MHEAAGWSNAKHSVEENGFAVLRSWMPSLSTDQILSHGNLARRFDAASRTHELIPRSEAPPNTYSGQHGLTCFPVHSDMAHWPEPPRYIWLRCLKGHSDVATLLLDGNDLVTRCGSNLLRRSLVRARRPLNGRLSLLSLYQQSRNGSASRLRWDEAYIVPASESGAQGMVTLREAIREYFPAMVSLSEPGDTLVIDNWRMLHGRSAVPESCRDRCLERAYLELLH